jgi:hypothetical protein
MRESTTKKVERALTAIKRLIIEALLVAVTAIAAYKVIRHELQSAAHPAPPAPSQSYSTTRYQ